MHLTNLQQSRDSHSQTLMGALNDLKNYFSDDNDSVDQTLSYHVNYITSLITGKNILRVDLESADLRDNLLGLLNSLNNTEHFSPMLANVMKVIKGHHAYAVATKSTLPSEIEDSFVNFLENIVYPANPSQKQLMGILTDGTLTYDQYAAMSDAQRGMIFPDGQVSLRALLGVDRNGIQAVLQSASVAPADDPLASAATAAFSAATSAVTQASSIIRDAFKSRETDANQPTVAGDERGI